LSGIELPALTPMVPDDLDEIMLIERQVFVDPWSRRMYLTDLTQNSLATYLVLRSHRRGHPAVLAYGGFWLLADDAHIATIASHPAWRGCGLGQLLLVGLLDAAAARRATRATLEVRISNLVAQRLYEKLGFQPVGTRKHYYRDGEDGLIMTTPPLASPETRAGIEAARRDAWLRVSQCLADDAAALDASIGAPDQS
jgi:ribosomal-protein-alanine N-acetyltransferase